jgi:Zn-dependent M28 family amino/carboxypeptidase
VVVNGTPVTINERFTDAGRKRFRDYWTQYMQGLGLQVNQLPYPATTTSRAGDNVEAVLAGASADSFVVIVHYDSIGPVGAETSNPGADDDMSGMAIELETARILVAHKAQLSYTVRFVASDAEELGRLAGARNYAAHIKALAQSEGFALVSAIDDEQTGWNCHSDAKCTDPIWPAFDIYSCGSGGGKTYDYHALGDSFAAITAKYSSLKTTRACMGANSDHFAMWEIGVPTLVFSEHSAFRNPHFDRAGGDTFDKIDTEYLVSIARPAITFQATLAGLQP